MARAKKTGNPIPREFSDLFDGLRTSPGVMMRQWLSYKGWKVPMSGKIEDLARHIVSFVAADPNGQREGEARALVAECREYGAKHVYMYTAPPSIAARWEWHGPEMTISDPGHARVRPATGVDRLNYVFDDGDTIRVSYSEKHVNFDVDRLAGTVRRISIQRVIVIAAVRSTGSVVLLLDPPGQHNPRGAGRVPYYTYWHDRAEALFGPNLTPVSLSKALGKLELGDTIAIPYSRLATAEGLIAVTGLSIADVRQHPQWGTLSRARAGYDEDEYIWKPRPAVAPATIGVPARPVRTEIYAQSGEVRFMQHALAVEVNYVLETLRSNS